MKEPVTILAGPRVANLRQRVWLLMLLDSAERSGIVPISKLRLHRAAYLANALSPLYDLPIPDGLIVKYKRGPYYPDIQWDIDRMAVQNFIRIFSLHHKKDQYGWWLDAEYGLTDTGLALVKKALKLPDLARIHQFLCEMTSAYSTIESNRSLDEVALKDVTFHNPDQELDTLIDLSEVKRNLSFQTAAAIQELVPTVGTLIPREQLHLYFRYMERLEKAAG